MGCGSVTDTENVKAARGPGEKIDGEEVRQFAHFFCYLEPDNILHVFNTIDSSYKAHTHSPMSDGSVQTAYVKIANRIYLAGGCLDKKPHKKCIMLKLMPDGTVGERTDIASMAVEKMANALVALDQKTIYSIGGFGAGKSLNVCEKYNVQTNSWESAQPLNEKKGGVSCCVYKNELIYAFGGRLSNETCEFAKKIELFDTVTNPKWMLISLKAGCYSGEFSACACHQYNDDILLCGGLVGNGWFFKPKDNSMADAGLEPIPDNRGFPTPMFEHDNLLYVADGDMQLVILDVTKKAWQTKAKDQWVKAGVKPGPVSKLDAAVPVQPAPAQPAPEKPTTAA